MNSDQPGYATTNGVTAFKDNVATAERPQVANFRRSDAILLGRSNTPAFSYRWFTNNDLHGRGREIPGLRLRCRRASTDRGSGRRALRSSDVDPALSVQTMPVQGPLARSVGDVRLALRGMSGADPRDPVHVPGAPAAPTVERPQRVALVRDPGVATPAAAVNAALDQAAGWLTDAGYLVEEVELPLLAEANRLWDLLCMEEFRQIMPLVEEVGDEGMKKAAEHYNAVASEWWGIQPSLTD